MNGLPRRGARQLACAEPQWTTLASGETRCPRVGLDLWRRVPSNRSLQRSLQMLHAVERGLPRALDVLG